MFIEQQNQTADSDHRYPWHHRLDEDFQELKKEHLRVLHGGEQARLKELKEINERLGYLADNKKRWT